HRPLIRPVAEAIAHQHIAALPRGILRLRSAPAVDEGLDAGIHADAPAEAIDEAKAALATRARVATLVVGAIARCALTRRVNILSRARATVDEATRDQSLECLTIHGAALALARHFFVRREAEPREILANGALVLGPAPLRVVIFDPKQHAAASFACHFP